MAGCSRRATSTQVTVTFLDPRIAQLDQDGELTTSRTTSAALSTATGFIRGSDDDATRTLKRNEVLSAVIGIPRSSGFYNVRCDLFDAVGFDDVAYLDVVVDRRS